MVSEKSILNDIKIYWDSDLDLIKKNLSISKNCFELDKIDAYAILTDWKEFSSLNINPEIVFDGRNIFRKSIYSIGKNF